MYLYKYPVISKEGNNYAVSIYNELYSKNSYTVKLYKNIKILWFNKSKCIHLEKYTFKESSHDEWLNEETLFRYMSEKIILEYEKINYKKMLLNRNINYFKNWDGECVLENKYD